MNFIPVCEPFLNGNEKKYVEDCVTSGWISSTGKYVTIFEEEFAKFCNAKYAVAVSNGTVALHLALVACDIKAGDEVIIPDFTMIASAFAICYTGARPVFVDVNPETWNIDFNKIEEKINSKTKAIMPVSIFGQPCEMDKINKLAKKYNLIVIEDAAESHGAIYNGKKTGNLADITAFSFFANKNLTTGEGGMVVTNNFELYNKIKYYKNLCFPLTGPREYIHHDIGFNYRISNIHAAIGCAQLEKANEYIEMRKRNALIYQNKLKDTRGISFQGINKNTESVYWMNAILVNREEYGHTRDELIEYLNMNSIETRLLFIGMHKQPSLEKFGCDMSGEYIVTEYLTNNGLYLPSASNLKSNEIEYVCDLIIKFSKNNQNGI
jgi:perosamine synthetase